MAMQTYNPYNPYAYSMGQFYQQPVQPQYYANPAVGQNMPVNRMDQSTSGPAIPGKVVESIDVVRTVDVPMDGNVYYFPRADGTEIYTKRWLPNGTTQIDAYKFINQGDDKGREQRENFGETLSGVNASLSQLEKRYRAGCLRSMRECQKLKKL